ncbi:MAG: tyrosine-protein phosphatase [Clostridia bacterium]|nr:tyrosine-protein phosphatase [Clostridia bacterium]
MKKIKFSVVFIAIAFLFSACSGVNRYGIDEGALDFDLRSVEKDICLPVVRDYLNATDYETQFVALKAMTDSGADRQVAEILLKIPKDGAVPYSFFISSSEDFAEYTVSEIEIDGKTEADEYTLGYAIEKNLVPGNEYFWKMTDKNGKIADYGKIAVKDAPVRFINVDNVRNVRDIGGWTGEGGKKVSYGLVYRGTRLNGNTDGSLLLSEKGKAVMRDELGVMTEIDLRAETDSSGIDNTVQNSCFFAEIVKGK